MCIRDRFDTLLRKILNPFKGIIALGILIIARVPNPNISSDNIKINVIKPIKIDLIVVTTI